VLLSGFSVGRACVLFARADVYRRMYRYMGRGWWEQPTLHSVDDSFGEEDGGVSAMRSILSKLDLEPSSRSNGSESTTLAPEVSAGHVVDANTAHPSASRQVVETETDPAAGGAGHGTDQTPHHDHVAKKVVEDKTPNSVTEPAEVDAGAKVEEEAPDHVHTHSGKPEHGDERERDAARPDDGAIPVAQTMEQKARRISLSILKDSRT